MFIWLVINVELPNGVVSILRPFSFFSILTVVLPAVAQDIFLFGVGASAASEYIIFSSGWNALYTKE